MLAKTSPFSANLLCFVDSSATLVGRFFLTAAHRKDSSETAFPKGKLNKMKSPIGTRDHLVAAAGDQFAARRGEGKAKM